MGNPLYGQNKLDDKLDVVQKDRKTYHFGSPPTCMDAADMTPADGVSGNIIENLYGDGLNISLRYQGTQTILVPAADTNGMDYAFDETNTDGVQWVMSQEVNKGITSGDSIDRFTVGSPAFYAELTLRIGTLAGTDDCAFGLRKVEAFQANVDDYDEAAFLNCIAGSVKSETILNGAATSTSAALHTMVADTPVRLGVYVSQAGVVSMKVNGNAVTDPSMTFDAGEVVTPFWFFLQNATTTDDVILEELTVGRQ